MILPPANRWHGRQVTALARLANAHDALGRATERQARSTAATSRRIGAPTSTHARPE